MEPPDAWAGTRRAPRLLALALALLLGAHPGMLGLRAGLEGCGFLEPEGERDFHPPQETKLATLGRRDMGVWGWGVSLIMRDLGTAKQRSWGHHSSGLETT